MAGGKKNYLSEVIRQLQNNSFKSEFETVNAMDRLIAFIKKSVSREIINHSNNQKPNSIMMIFKGYLKKWVISKS